MLKYDWKLDIKYSVGDIIFIINNLQFAEYYICSTSHISDEFVNPQSIIYWIPIKGIQIYPEQLEVITQPSLKLNLGTMKDIFNVSFFDIDAEIKPSKQENKLKRKLESIELEISTFKKKKKSEDTLDLKDQILLLNVDIKTKVFLLEKHSNLIKTCGSEYAKGHAWMKTVLNVPFKKYNNFKIKSSDKTSAINAYFDTVRQHLDNKIHDMDDVKDEIIQFLARKISNPNSKGHILALQGGAGVGKSKLLKTLAEALQLPFHQINFGGLNDVSILTGHSETYTASKPGKFVEILTSAGCMNPIIFLDEIDKISSTKSKELNGILTHLLDEDQNHEFQDNYLSNINIDLSKVFFVIAFNEIDNVDSIVLNRMKVINIKDIKIENKLIIAKEKMIPDILNSLILKKDIYINLDPDLINFIIKEKTPIEPGVRQLKKSLEKIFNKINYLILTDKYKKDKDLFIDIELGKEIINIKKRFIDNCIEFTQQNESSHMHMYI